MDLILWRHAEAEPGEPDLGRRLTAKGIQQAERMAKWLDRHLPATTRILSSPADRAQQTARALKRKFRVVPETRAGRVGGRGTGRGRMAGRARARAHRRPSADAGRGRGLSADRTTRRPGACARGRSGGCPTACAPASRRRCSRSSSRPISSDRLLGCSGPSLRQDGRLNMLEFSMQPSGRGEIGAVACRIQANQDVIHVVQ